MSTPPFEELSSLDRLIHEPARLSILTALAACHATDFMFLLSLTGLTRGNLATHLAKLEQAGLITVERTFKGKVRQTLIQLTEAGRSGVQRHWDRLDALRKAAGKWRQSTEPPLMRREDAE